MDRQFLKKSPPHSLDAERLVLAGIMLNCQVLDELTEILDVSDFYDHRHRVIYSHMLLMHNAQMPISFPSLYEFLREKSKLLEAGDANYLFSISDTALGAIHAIESARLVKKLSLQRQAIYRLSSLIPDFYSSDLDLDATLEDAQQCLYKLSCYDLSHNNEIHIGNAVDSIVKNIILDDENILGIPSGFDALDQITNGFSATDLIIIAARPSMGKTSFALSCILNMASYGISAYFASLEMSKNDLIMRAIASIARVDLHKMRSGYLSEEEKEMCVNAGKILSNLPIWIDDTPAQSITQLRNKLRRLQKKCNIQIAFIDYLQLLRVNYKTESREREVAEISSSLKAIAKELQIPVIALSQLNRKLEERTDKRPRLADLRESGAIEQDADLILFLYRDEVYKKNTNKKGIAEVIVEKHRNGRLGTVELAYFAQYTLFSNLARCAK
jgi:replicative DNA helicase